VSGYPKRLIEVDLPIKKISAHARRGKVDPARSYFDAAHLVGAAPPGRLPSRVVCGALARSRKIAQGLGAHLELLANLVEIKGETARLLPVAGRRRIRE